MLFLTVRYDVPIGLVRLLIGQWIRNPFSLWLRVNCRFKYYLKLHEPPFRNGDPEESVTVASTAVTDDGLELGPGMPSLSAFVATTEEDKAFADELAAMLARRSPPVNK